MNFFILHALIIFIVSNFWFVIGVSKKRNDIADVAWGLNFIIIVLAGVYLNQNVIILILFVLILAWGLRLSSHIGKRFLKKDKEDSRYAAWRENWGKHWVVFSWLKVFLLQGIFLYLIALPIITSSYFSYLNFGYINFIGFLIWKAGFLFEMVADKQLREFIQKKDNQGKIMKYGLWKNSRHPNYFGESVMWWGIWIITYGSPYFWINIISPITITYLLRFVSGVPLAEKNFNNNKEFLEYKKNTPAMLPNFFIK